MMIASIKDQRTRLSLLPSCMSDHRRMLGKLRRYYLDRRFSKDQVQHEAPFEGPSQRTGDLHCRGKMSIVVAEMLGWTTVRRQCTNRYTNDRCFEGTVSSVPIGQMSAGRALRHQKSNLGMRNIAEERVDILLRLANETVKSNASLSKRYVELAQRVAMRCGVRLGPERKQFICKRCRSPLVPGFNCRVRVRTERGTHVTVTCLGCGSTKRYPAVKEKRLRRR